MRLELCLKPQQINKSVTQQQQQKLILINSAEQIAQEM